MEVFDEDVVRAAPRGDQSGTISSTDNLQSFCPLIGEFEIVPAVQPASYASHPRRVMILQPVERLLAQRCIDRKKSSRPPRFTYFIPFRRGRRQPLVRAMPRNGKSTSTLELDAR